jgi:hypothetical protein
MFTRGYIIYIPLTTMGMEPSRNPCCKPPIVSRGTQLLTAQCGQVGLVAGKGQGRNCLGDVTAGRRKPDILGFKRQEIRKDPMRTAEADLYHMSYMYIFNDIIYI